MDNTTTNVQGWISVKDRKPEAGITVIGGHAEHNWVCGVEFDGKQWYNQFDESDVPVYPTHWQLMPKPPIKSGLVVSEGLIDRNDIDKAFDGIPENKLDKPLKLKTRE